MKPRSLRSCRTREPTNVFDTSASVPGFAKQGFA